MVETAPAQNFAVSYPGHTNNGLEGARDPVLSHGWHTHLLTLTFP